MNILTDGRNTRDGGRADGVLVCDTVPLPRAWMRLESAVARDRALLSHFFRPRCEEMQHAVATMKRRMSESLSSCSQARSGAQRGLR